MPDAKPKPRCDWFSDTHPEALEVFLNLQREMPAGQKLALAFELTDFALRMQEGHMKAANPGMTEREVFLRCAARRLDRESMIGAYGWDPEAHR